MLLDVIGRFIHLERRDGNGKEALIFPRFQQLDAVRNILSDAQRKGTGQNYLIQHSAGSGKSNTIAWIAHQIINLHDDEDRPLFDTAIIVTDRLVLDRQLQSTISGFAQTSGVVETIDGTSRTSDAQSSKASASSLPPSRNSGPNIWQPFRDNQPKICGHRR